MMPYQQRSALGAVETEGVICRQVAAGADPDLEPTATHQVEYRGVLRHSDRELERQRHDPGPQADSRRPGSDLGEKYKRCRQAAFVLVKMVLRHPCGVKAAAFGMDDLRGGQAIALGCIRPIEQAREKAEAERRLRYGPCHVPGRRRSRSGRIGWRHAFTWSGTAAGRFPASARCCFGSCCAK